MLHKRFRKNRGEKSGKWVENKSHIWITRRYLQKLAAEICWTSVWRDSMRLRLLVRRLSCLWRSWEMFPYTHLCDISFTQQQWPPTRLVLLGLRRTNGISFYHIWSLCCLWWKSLKRVMCARVCVTCVPKLKHPSACFPSCWLQCSLLAVRTSGSPEFSTLSQWDFCNGEMIVR